MSDAAPQNPVTMIALSAKEKADAAYRLAEQAHDAIDAHERLCAERYAGIRDDQQRIEKGLGDLSASNAEDRREMKASVGRVHERVDALKSEINAGAFKVLWAVLAGTASIIAAIWLKGLAP